MTNITKSVFGTTESGKKVDLYTFVNKNNASMEIITYGGAIRSLTVPTRKGMVDVVLGHDTVADYEKQDKYLGAILGRFANRIGGGKFTLNGKEYTLFANNGKNHLHGGKEGFNKKIWNAQVDGESLILSYISPDGEEGYPGSLSVIVKYSFTDENEWIIETTASCDSDTIVNISNHPYVNLEGHGSGDIGRHIMKIYAHSFTENDEESLPTGKIIPVEGTPMDFLNGRKIGDDIDSDYIQIKYGSGYDHNWIIDREAEEGLVRAAEVFAPETGIRMEVITTQPGIQLYSGNFLDGDVKGKGEAVYSKRSGLSLEAQGFPNSTKCKKFPSAVLKQGEIYRQKTVYKFSAES